MDTDISAGVLGALAGAFLAVITVPFFIWWDVRATRRQSGRE